MLKKTKLCTGLMVACGGVLLCAGGNAFAQAAAAAPPPIGQLERVEITGSSIKRIDAETALPVQVITREQIQNSGAQNVEQLLQSVSAVTSSGGLTTASASGATTGGISAVSIHGLTSLRTLVLLNGRRIAPYGIGFTGDSVSVDVNSIPLSAIERVEVLKDGASAVYGSDAIAGVINFILRQEVKGVELTGEYGNTTQGGANFKRVTATAGFGSLASDRFNVMVVGSYQKEGSLLGADRGFASSGINVDANNDTTSGNTFPGNIAPFDPVTGAIGGTRNPGAPGCPAPYAISDPAFFPLTRCRFDPSPLVTLIPASERTSIFATGKFAITNDIQAFAEASYNRNTIQTIIQPVPLSDQFAIPANNVLCNQAPYNTVVPGNCVAAIVIRPTSPFYPTAYAQSQYGATPDLLVRYRSALTGNRDLTDISEAPRFVAGVKGTTAGWDFDVAALYSESKVREQVNAGYPAYSQIMPLLNSGTVNLFGPNTTAIEDQARATGFVGDAFTIKSSLTSLAARASSEVYQMSAGPLGVAFGAEARQEKYNFSSNPTIQTGDISGYGGNFLPVNKSRSVEALFAEANIPIAKNLEANVAARYDHYEGVGNSFTPKASLRWQPTPQVLLRTSYGAGFRAPSLQDLFAPNTQGVTPPGLSDIQRCSPPLAAPPPGGNSSNDCQTQFTTTNGGNAILKPEKSKNFTLGTVLEPVNNVSFSVDYFKITLNDTIVNGVDAATILAVPDKYAALIQRGAPDPLQPGLPGHITNILQTNINLGTTKVAGFDMDLKWRIPTAEWGKFTVYGSATYYTQFDTSNLDGTFTGGVDTVNAATGGVVPRFKATIAVDWGCGPWGVTVASNFQKAYNDLPGTFEDPSDPAFVNRRVASYTTFDLQGTYQAFKSWRFTLGARNVFDKNPPYTNAGGQTSFQAGYDPQYADPRGRFVYGRVTYSFQ
jgi:iron complex outermembrane receptor protein